MNHQTVLLAEEHFSFAANSSAMIGVVQSGMLPHRMEIVHMLDCYDSSVFKVIVHSASVDHVNLGSSGFLFTLATPIVWLLIISVVFTVSVFHAMNYKLYADSVKKKAFYNHIFTLFATAISQGKLILFE